MRWRDALVLGAVQGLTEFLPVSSSAHVSLAGRLLRAGDPGSAFTAVTQIGTEFAVLVAVREDLARITHAWIGSLSGRVAADDPAARVGRAVLVGTLPIGVLGYLGRDVVTGPLRSSWVTSTMLGAFALVMAEADARAATHRDFDDLTARDGFALGLWQALALIPGVSRSGATLTGGLRCGFTREAAVRVSLLLSVPSVLLSGGHQLLGLGGEDEVADVPKVAAATAVAFGTGAAVAHRLGGRVTSAQVQGFARYRLTLSAATTAGLLLRRRATAAHRPDRRTR